MAARIDPRHVSRAHQKMRHFVANAPFDDSAVLAVARDYALAQLERHAPIGAWVGTTPGFQGRGSTRSELCASTAGGSANSALDSQAPPLPVRVSTLRV